MLTGVIVVVSQPKPNIANYELKSNYMIFSWINDESKKFEIADSSIFRQPLLMCVGCVCVIVLQSAMIIFFQS